MTSPRPRIRARRGWVGLAVVTLFAGLTAADESPTASRQGGGRDYQVGVADQLGIVVWGEPQISRSVRVRPDGKISLPFVQDVLVEGKTPNEIRSQIVEGLSGFVREPNVTVIVEEINSFNVYFLGEVRTQGVVSFFRPTRVLQAIAAAGGLTDFAKKEITLIRVDGDSERRISVDYKRLVLGDPAQENLFLRSGDVLLFH